MKHYEKLNVLGRLVRRPGLYIKLILLLFFNIPMIMTNTVRIPCKMFCSNVPLMKLSIYLYNPSSNGLDISWIILTCLQCVSSWGSCLS